MLPMCLLMGLGQIAGLMLTVWGGVGFDLEIIAGNGSVLVQSFVGVGWVRVCKLDTCRTAP